jgi:hypothetical protein
VSERLTDEDLDAIEGAVNDMAPGQIAIALPVDHARRLVAEVRRLRSDEWLVRTAREVSRSVGGIEGWRNQELIEAILRKHREGE